MDASFVLTFADAYEAWAWQLHAIREEADRLLLTVDATDGSGDHDGAAGWQRTVAWCRWLHGVLQAQVLQDVQLVLGDDTAFTDGRVPGWADRPEPTRPSAAAAGTPWADLGGRLMLWTRQLRVWHDQASADPVVWSAALGGAQLAWAGVLDQWLAALDTRVPAAL